MASIVLFSFLFEPAFVAISIMKNLVLFLVFSVFAQFSSAKDIHIEIKADDQMRYSAKSFEVTEGQRVTLTFSNVGKIPVESMGHNIVILRPGTIIPMFAAKCGAAKSTHYVPQDPESKKAIVAHSKLIGGGQKDVVYFIAPAPGSYPYFCSYPGHFSCMQGTMVVKPKP